MPALIAAGVSIGILAGIWTSFSMIGQLVTYAGFFAWASFYAAGGGVKGLKDSLICNFAGVVYGFLIVQLSLIISPIVGDVVGLGIALGLLSMVMCWQAKLPIFSFIPGVFIGCATYFASGTDFIGSVIGLIFGALLGYISQVGGNILTKADRQSEAKVEASTSDIK